MPRTRSPYLRSPASLVLAREGLRLRDVADEMGSSIESVSAVVVGRVPCHNRFLAAVTKLAGFAVADEIRRLVEAERNE
jgi:hypothetical protein